MTFKSIDAFSTQVGQQIRFRLTQGEIPENYRGIFEVVSTSGDNHEPGHRLLKLNGRLVEYSPAQNRLGAIPLPWGFKVESKGN